MAQAEQSGLTRSEMVEEINANLGIAPNKTGRTDMTTTRIQRHLNLAQMRIAREPTNDWEELVFLRDNSVTLSNVVALDRRVILTANRWDFAGALPISVSEISSGQDVYDLLLTDASGISTGDWIVIPLTNGGTEARRILRVVMIGGSETNTVTYSGAIGGTLDTSVMVLKQDRPKEINSVVYLKSGETLSKKLTRMPNRQWDALFGTSTNPTSAEVNWYTFHNFVLYIWGIPSTNYTLTSRRIYWPRNLETDASKSDFDHKDDLLIALATHSAFQSLGMLDDAGRWFAIYSDMLRAAMKENAKKVDLLVKARGISERTSFGHDRVRDPFSRTSGSRR